MSGNDEEEVVEFFVAIEELLKVLLVIVLGNYREIFCPCIDKDDSVINLRACVITTSLVAYLLKIVNYAVTSEYFEHVDIEDDLMRLLLEASDAIEISYDDLESSKLSLDATMREYFHVRVVGDVSESGFQDLFEFCSNSEMIV